MIKELEKVKLTELVFLWTVWTILLGTNNLLKYFFIHLSIKNWRYSFFLKMSFNNTISSWNFSYEEQMENERWSKVQTKPNLYATGIKLLKLVKTPLNDALQKTDITN